jgi:hypothetical protein
MKHLYKYFTSISDVIEDLTDIEELEIEGRLGCFSANQSTFSANIGEKYFREIQDLLSLIPSVEGTCELIDQKDFFHDNLRLTIQNNEKTCIENVKLHHFGFQSSNLLLDMRLTISREKQRNIDTFPTTNLDELECRHKKRLRYKIGNLYLDLTEVLEYHPHSTKRGYKTYEYEIEVVDPRKEFDFFYTIEQIFLVLLDAIAYCKEPKFIKNESNQHNFEELKDIKFIEPNEDDSDNDNDSKA